jgi:hypothetical protein
MIGLGVDVGGDVRGAGGGDRVPGAASGFGVFETSAGRPWWWRRRVRSTFAGCTGG